MSKIKIIKVEDVPGAKPQEFSLHKGDGTEERPATAGEQRADRPSQAADRAMLDTLAALERERVTLYSIFNAHGTSRARQLEVSARLDEIEASISNYRRNLAGKTQVAKGERIVGRVDPLSTRHRHRAALDALMHLPTIQKDDAEPVTTTLTREQRPVK